MKYQCIFIFLSWLVLFFIQSVQANEPVVRTAGIGLRGTYWKNDQLPADFTIYHNQRYSEVNVGGGGGWLSFYSRLNSNWLVEISIGGIGQVHAKATVGDSQYVHAVIVTPLLFGLRHELFNPRQNNGFQPYVSVGIGPYWVHDTVTRQAYPESWYHHHDWDDDEDEDVEITAKTRLMKGGYAGGGVNLALTSWMGLNFDVKYHFIDFTTKHKNSGFEYGLGLNFMWGRYK
ncbi:hypothetical protein L0128_16640 [candidate division KSB1 bacterium]|nr:hypothetical protein [candidate division KSB1 bacterium]